MDILRNLFGSLTSGIIRLLVAVGILAAAYFFIVKPVLKTTDNAIDSANQSFEKSFGVHGVDITDISGTIEDVNKQMQREIRRSFHTAKQRRQPEAAGQVHPARQGQRAPHPALHRQVLSAGPFEQARSPGGDSGCGSPLYPHASQRTAARERDGIEVGTGAGAPDPGPGLAELAEQQHGVVSIRQLETKARLFPQGRSARSRLRAPASLAPRRIRRRSPTRPNSGPLPGCGPRLLVPKRC